MDKKRVHVWIEGRVQGVFFRAFTQDTAVGLGLGGWVRNLPDGRVEAVFEGDAEKVDRMIQWCHDGSPYSHVDHVEVRDEVYHAEYDGFEIRYGR